MLQCQHSNLVIIVRADQVQGAFKSQLQLHGSCLHRLNTGTKVSLTKGWCQTGERTKIKAQQSHEIWVSSSFETERSTFQTSDIESNLNCCRCCGAPLDIWGAQQLRTGCLSILMFLAPLAEVTP